MCKMCKNVMENVYEVSKSRKNSDEKQKLIESRNLWCDHFLSLREKGELEFSNGDFKAVHKETWGSRVSDKIQSQYLKPQEEVAVQEEPIVQEDPAVQEEVVKVMLGDFILSLKGEIHIESVSMGTRLSILEGDKTIKISSFLILWSARGTSEMQQSNLWPTTVSLSSSV